VRYYALSAGEIDLERYSRRTVDLFGPVSYPTDLRGTGLVRVEKIDTGR
jgi:hypothetical protein